MDKKDNLKQFKWIYLITIIGIIIDQISKFIIVDIFGSVDISTISGKYGIFDVIPYKGIEIISNFFYIVKVENTGGAWGIFSDNIILLSIVSMFVLVLLYFFARAEKEITKLSITYYSLLFSGIIGNLIDRLFRGYVVDFFNFYIFEYDYPVFNLADVFIVLGVLLMIYDVLRGEVDAIKSRKRK